VSLALTLSMMGGLLAFLRVWMIITRESEPPAPSYTSTPKVSIKLKSGAW